MPEFIPQHTPHNLDAFTKGYLEAAEWLLPEDVDRNTITGFHPDTIAKAKADCEKFMRDNRADLVRYFEISERPKSHAGHDFWLSRVGAGTGFWDRGKDPVFQKLEAAAKTFPEVSIVAGDGLMYIE